MLAQTSTASSTMSQTPTAMDTANSYWTFLSLTASGKLCTQTHPIAQPHFSHDIQPLLFSADTTTPLPHRILQRTLHDQHLNALKASEPSQKGNEIIQNPKSKTQNPKSLTPPETCLRCFISHNIDYACQQLATQFGTTHSFDKMDLLPLVLPDDRLQYPPTRLAELTSKPNPSQEGNRGVRQNPKSKIVRLNAHAEVQNPKSTYRSLPTHIFTTFNPTASNLKTWTVRLVRQDRDLNDILLEHGVYLVSDWAILNDTKEPQLKRILSEFYTLTPVETEQAALVLESYHAVYVSDRLQHGISGRCDPPSGEQLKRICAYFNHHLDAASPMAPIPDAKSAFQRLQTLAHCLRDYRIHIRRKTVPTQSFDAPESGGFVSQVAVPVADESDDDTQDFLRRYRQIFTDCLDDAIDTVMERRMTQLQKRKGERDKLFLKGLELFCHGKTMTEIAPQLGYERQDKVTYLLKLKDLRTDIRHEMLTLLRDRLRELVQYYANPEQLHSLDDQLDVALSEQISDLMNDAERETTGAREGPLKSRLFQRLRHYLDHRP